jgi:predicted transcriptional regulator
MNSIPSATEIRAALQPYTIGKLMKLSDVCGVPWTTLVKIRNGQTTDPRLETVRAVWPALVKNQRRLAA